MELPITVIVVLFVAMVVGGLVIGFSQQNLSNAQQRLNERFTEDLSEDSIIEVSTATSTTITSLAEECIARGAQDLDTGVCFALFADTFPDVTALDGTNLSNGFTLNTTAAPASPQALRFTFDPRGTIRVN